MNRRAPGSGPRPRTDTAGATEPESVQRLRKVLELELRRGCDDSAVIGGLDGFLTRAGQDKAVAALLASVPRLTSGYGRAEPAGRQRWLRAVLDARPRPAGSNRSGALGGAERAPAASSDNPGSLKPSPPGSTRAHADSEAGPIGPGSRTRPKAQPLATLPADRLDQPVTVVKGVKEGLQARLAKLDVHTVRDLIFLFPNRHNDFGDVRHISDLNVGEEQTCIVNVWSAQIVRLGKMHATQAIVGDGSGTMRVVWFNQTWLAEQLRTNDRVVLSGKVGQYNGQKTMENPEWERVEKSHGDDFAHTARLVPVYPLTQGLSQRVLRRVVKEAVDSFAALVPEPLPSEIRRRRGLIGIVEAMRHLHYPDSKEQYAAAKERMAFQELLCVQLVVLERRAAWQDGRAPGFDKRGILDVYRSALPFALTGAQERVLGEILADISSTRPMARLLQGDVGSGKTAVAGAALAVAAANGLQSALMAPTEILAEQHYRTLTGLLGRLTFADRGPLRVEMLTGSVGGRARRGLIEDLAAGEIDVAVGTHALIQEGVNFKRLGLTVVDEQHRFGVMQRASLRERAANAGRETPHLLVMSATPIPRTLALTLYGDLDVSVIDEMPPGRLPVETHSVGRDEEDTAFEFIRQKVQEGRQAFVICPLVEESENVVARAATEEHARLSSEVFPELRLGLLHGRMASAEKEAVLDAFRRGETHILVATTVVEVGIDIPNATVMLIEGADRFGLAQLHQLRGRVGRGAEQSYCLLLSEDPSYSARQRLQVMESTNDGFALAEHDLRLRGPGDYLGTRQSGVPELQVADISNVRQIEAARSDALAILTEDPGLAAPEHAALAREVSRAKRLVSGEVS